ncbi:MAG: hypothetical protein RLZ98_161, partial [Pseudomonadota bacterium]
FYLDFEAMNPAIPLFTGTRPYQRIPFQWSLHTRFGNGPLKHQEFLADAASDPRRAFATSLIDAIADSDVPIAVYSSYERSVLSELARDFPDLADQISDITARLIDLLAVVRREVYLASFNGSFSIKTVGPALAPGLTYDDLETVRDGEAASIAFQRLAAGGIENAEVQALRNALLAYCARDTLAMVAVHDGLRALVHGTRIAAE